MYDAADSVQYKLQAPFFKFYFIFLIIYENFNA